MNNTKIIEVLHGGSCIIDEEDTTYLCPHSHILSSPKFDGKAQKYGPYIAPSPFVLLEKSFL